MGSGLDIENKMKPLPFTKKLHATPGVSCRLSNLAAGAFHMHDGPDAIALVPYADGLFVNNAPLRKMFPHLSVDPGCRFENRSSLPVLAFVISLPPGASLWAHGSRARTDFKPSSDLDLICISDHEREFETKAGQVSVFFNCRSLLMDRAASGDLFARHLTRGTLPIHDNCGDLARMQSAFKAAPNYDSILHHSADFADFLMSDLMIPRFEKLALEKLLWCVRTALMAEGHDIFLPGHHADADDVICMDALRAVKYGQSLDTGELCDLVTKFFDKRPIKSLLPKTKSIPNLEAFFDATGNRIASRFVAQNRPMLNLAINNNKGAPETGTPLA